MMTMAIAIEGREYFWIQPRHSIQHGFFHMVHVRHGKELEFVWLGGALFEPLNVRNTSAP